MDDRQVAVQADAGQEKDAAVKVDLRAQVESMKDKNNFETLQPLYPVAMRCVAELWCIILAAQPLPYKLPR